MLLDDERNDLFVHIDAKVQNVDESRFQKFIKKAELIFLKNRIDVKWAHVTVVKAELLLMEAASNKRSYQYYHIISGADLPLMNQDELHAFFAKHEGKEFLTIAAEGSYLKDKMERMHLFPIYANPDTALHRLTNKLTIFWLKVQKKLNLRPMRYFLPDIKKGNQWASLTDDCVRYLLKRMKKDLKWYQFSSCADEHYKQTCVFDSCFLAKVYEGGSIHYIDWSRSNGCSPHTNRLDDFDTLMKSQKVFARKFDENVDFAIVEKICEHLNTQL